VNAEFINSLMVVGYLITGTVAIALIAGWLLKRFGPRK
jgi:hypothetical protein